MSYGSKAFGHPFQPSSVKVLSVAPDHVCHVFRRSGCAQSVPPSRMLTVVPSPAKPWFQASANLCVFASRTPSCFRRSKLPAPRSGRGRVGHFLLPQVVHGRLQRRLRRCLVQVRLGDPERRSCLLQPDELHRDDPRQPGELRRRGDAERADHQRDVARIRVPAVAQERGGGGAQRRSSPLRRRRRASWRPSRRGRGAPCRALRGRSRTST